MAKRKSFEDILNAEIRWPRQGDVPFVPADDPYDNARIADDGFTRLVLMTDGYKAAADLMIAECGKDRRSRDVLIFPIIFNYRQYLELSLKYQLSTYGRAVGIEANWDSHNLADLWSEFHELLERYGTTDPDEADPVVGNIILEFAKIDPGPYSYRYPVDRRGNLVPVAYPALHLETLVDVMKAVDSYFTGTDGYLNSLEGFNT